MRKFFKSLLDKFNNSSLAILMTLLFLGILLILYKSTRQLVDETYTEARQAGYDSGYSDGYDSGYSDGYDIGCDSGYDRGYDDGFTDGYGDAYDEFYDGSSEE